jgi:hypothetical protein
MILALPAIVCGARTIMDGAGAHSFEQHVLCHSAMAFAII